MTIKPEGHFHVIMRLNVALKIMNYGSKFGMVSYPMVSIGIILIQGTIFTVYYYLDLGVKSF